MIRFYGSHLQYITKYMNGYCYHSGAMIKNIWGHRVFTLHMKLKCYHLKCNHPENMKFRLNDGFSNAIILTVNLNWKKERKWWVKKWWREIRSRIKCLGVASSHLPMRSRHRVFDEFTLLTTNRVSSLKMHFNSENVYSNSTRKAW